MSSCFFKSVTPLHPCTRVTLSLFSSSSLTNQLPGSRLRADSSFSFSFPALEIVFLFSAGLEPGPFLSTSCLVSLLILLPRWFSLKLIFHHILGSFLSLPLSPSGYNIHPYDAPIAVIVKLFLLSSFQTNYQISLKFSNQKISVWDFQDYWWVGEVWTISHRNPSWP